MKTQLGGIQGICVIFSGGIFFSWLRLTGRSQPSSCQCIPDMCQGLRCCHTSGLAPGQREVLFISGWPGCAVLCARGEGGG